MMSAADPTVSVVMATFNGAAFLRDTIDSVLAQTMPDFEIVVADDCSTDDTLAVLAAIDDPRLRVINVATNGGPAPARTLAMAQARGRFIVGLDQDDICRPDRFARQIAYLYEHPDVALVASTMEMFAAGSGFETVRRDPHPDLVDPDAIDWTMWLLNPIGWSTVMMRAEAARALIPFQRDELRFAEDFDLYTRIRAYGRIGRIAEPLIRYRLHAGGASQAFEEGMIASAARVLADRYAPHFGEGADEAAMLMSRHAASRYPPPDAATLARLGVIVATLLALQGHVAPGFSERSASALWWRIARAGLRAGRYGMMAMLRARPGFAPPIDVLLPATLRDALIGAARRAGMRR